MKSLRQRKTHFLRNAQMKTSLRNDHAAEMKMKVSRQVKTQFLRSAQMKTSPCKDHAAGMSCCQKMKLATKAEWSCRQMGEDAAPSIHVAAATNVQSHSSAPITKMVPPALLMETATARNAAATNVRQKLNARTINPAAHGTHVLHVWLVWHSIKSALVVDWVQFSVQH